MTARRDAVEPAAILDEHRTIHAAVEALRAHMRAPIPVDRANWLKRLAEDLDALSGLLRPHFTREEEAAGLFEIIETAQPESVRQCTVLRAQHGALLDRLGALEQKLNAPPHDAKSVETLLAGIRALLAALSRHEAAENVLLLRTMEGEEVGAPD